MIHTDQLHPRVSLINKDGTPTPFFHKWLLSMWEKTGGHGDFIDDLKAQEIFGGESGAVIDLSDNIEAYDFRPSHEEDDIDYSAPTLPQVFTAVTKNISYTALPFDFIAVTEKSTISLPSNPDDNDQVIVVNVNGNQVTVDGNGKGINNDTSVIFLRANTTIVFQYFIDLDKWYMR